MTYTMDLADEVGPADEVIEDQGVKILIEPKDLMFLLGTKLDFETTTLQSSFTFQNPNQTGSCGCGNQFRSLRPARRRNNYPSRVFLPGSVLPAAGFKGLTVAGRSRNMGTWSPMPTTGELSSF